MMNLKNKMMRIFYNVVPVILMIALIPIITNDFILTGVYILIITISFLIKYDKKDFVFLVFGFFIMALSEYFFISTGVEIFVRNSLFGLMPFWLPFLWAYVFVVMKRSIIILSK